MFTGAINSGKNYGLVKSLNFYEDEHIKDSDNNILQIRAILFCLTANSAANPMFQFLKSLQEDDIMLYYSDIYRGRRGLMVKAAGLLSLDRQFEPYPRANTVAPSWCGLGCRTAVGCCRLSVRSTKWRKI
jgi:hypothetical protein